MFMRQERRSEEAWILRRVDVLLLLKLKKLKVEVEISYVIPIYLSSTPASTFPLSLSFSEYIKSPSLRRQTDHHAESTNQYLCLRIRGNASFIIDKHYLFP